MECIKLKMDWKKTKGDFHRKQWNRTVLKNRVRSRHKWQIKMFKHLLNKL